VRNKPESSIAYLLEDSKLQGKDLIDALKTHPVLKRCYARPLAGRDNHSLEEHTLKAINCFEDNFQGKAKIIFEPQHFKLLFAFHDLGKPQAMAEQEPDKQHQFTLKIIDQVSDELNLPKPLLQKIIAVIDADPIGKYLNSKHNLPIESSLSEINKMAAALSIAVSALWPTLLVYYYCDAAGYESLRRKVFLTDDKGKATYFDDAQGFKLKDPTEAEKFTALEQRVKVHC
jgi:hypothetical protein